MTSVAGKKPMPKFTAPLLLEYAVAKPATSAGTHTAANRRLASGRGQTSTSSGSASPP